jgi:thiamine kinase-like enzyme
MDYTRMSTNFPQLHGIPEQFLPDNINSVQVIEGGLNNRNFLINETVLIKSYLKRDEKNDPVLLRYFRERDAFQNLNHCNFLPKLLKTSENENQHFFSRQWVNGKIISLQDIQKDPNCLITPLIQLHSEQYSSQGDFNYFDVISRYLREYSLNASQIPSGLPEFTALESFFADKKNILEASGKRSFKTRIHGDLAFSNIISSNTENHCYFIDWEYTTIGTPLIDIAYLFTQNPIPDKTQRLIFSLYCESVDTSFDENLLELYKQLMTFMSALWYSLQAFRIKKGSLTHGNVYLSMEEFQNLAEKSFSSLKLDQQ